MASAADSPKGLSYVPSPTSPALSTTATAFSSSPSTTPCRLHTACWNYEEGNSKDAANDLEQPCHGWPALAHVIVENPGFEAFQAFRDLNIKSLLYYQAELVQLRKELHALEWEDHRKGGDSARLCSNVRSLLLTKKSPEAQDQLKKVKEIREVLKEYNAALLQYAKIGELPEAEPFNVKSLHTWIDMHMARDLNITGPGRDSWGVLGRPPKSTTPKSLWWQFFCLLGSIFWEGKSEEEDLDLVAPQRTKEIDSLTRWVAGHWTPFWHDLGTAFKGTKTYEVVAPFYCLLRLPFRQKKKDEEKDGILRDRTRSNASTLSVFKRWRLFQQQVAAEQRREDKVASLSTYSVNAMIRFTNHVATVVACLFPIIAIVVLSKIHTQAKILGFIALFTAVFAIGLMILTNAGTSRTEIFTATAAFAAVLVVFVQNQNPGRSG